MDEAISRARDAFSRHEWRRAYEQLSVAAEDEAIEVDDLERLASAAYLVGRKEESTQAWARAHQQCAQVGEVARATRCAFWLAFVLLNTGELARGGGWTDRAQRLLDEHDIDCVEHGYLRYAAALHAVFSGDDLETASMGFNVAAEIGARFADTELTTLARISEGRCLIYLGETNAGVALLDEAMVAVGVREVSPMAVGDAYCTVIEGCQELFDVRRMREWTNALSRWCDEQPELVFYRGICLVHRAEVMQLRGEWSDAADEVERAVQRLTDPPGQAALGAACYVRAELHRLRGDFAEADRSYRAASELGHDPQPGIALLRHAQGRVSDADSALRRALSEADDPLTRGKILGPYVEVALASRDLDAAATAAAEMESIAAALDQPFLHAVAAHAVGLVHLARDEPQAALGSLRRAWTHWRELEALYEAARTRVHVALACRALGDADGAEMELDAARAVFSELGARPDVARVDALAPRPARTSGGLTQREVEVLGLVAKGKTNRQIADQLVISEKTVASHLSHMFTKLGLSSRAAATAYAYENGLI